MVVLCGAEPCFAVRPPQLVPGGRRLPHHRPLPRPPRPPPRYPPAPDRFATRVLEILHVVAVRQRPQRRGRSSGRLTRELPVSRAHAVPPVRPVRLVHRRPVQRARGDDGHRFEEFRVERELVRLEAERVLEYVATGREAPKPAVPRRTREGGAADRHGVAARASASVSTSAPPCTRDCSSRRPET